MLLKSSWSFLLLVLLALACGCRRSAAGWQPSSATVPQFETALPPFLSQSEDRSVWPPRNRLISLDIASGESSDQEVTGALDLTALLAAEYRVAGTVLLGHNDQIYVVLGGQVAPNGLWVAQQEEGGLVLRRVDAAGSRILSASGRSPVWSLDGQWLAYQDDNGLWALSLADLSSRLLFSTTPLEPLAWSADSGQLLGRDQGRGIILDTASLSQRTLAGVDAGQIHGRPVWSPDGQTIYARYGENGRLDISSAHTLPDGVMARLVAVQTDGSANPLSDLLPTGDDQGVSRFWLSPDGSAIMAHHYHCARRASGLIPVPVRQCEGRLLALETVTGRYRTIGPPPLFGLQDAGWQQSWPPVNLADLPIP